MDPENEIGIQRLNLEHFSPLMKAALLASSADVTEGDRKYTEKPVCGCASDYRYNVCPKRSSDPFMDCSTYPHFLSPRPKKNPDSCWVHLGQIRNQGVDNFRFLCLIDNQLGDKSVPLVFYPEDVQNETFRANANKLRPGNTICLVNHVPKLFKDGRTGIKCDDVDFLVFNAPLETVIQEGKKALFSLDCKEFKSRSGLRKCFSCGVSGQRLQKCSSCNLAYYCGRQCQVSAFSSHHKALCPEMKRLVALASLGRWNVKRPGKGKELFEEFMGRNSEASAMQLGYCPPDTEGEALNMSLEDWGILNSNSK